MKILLGPIDCEGFRSLVCPKSERKHYTTEWNFAWITVIILLLPEPRLPSQCSWLVFLLSNINLLHPHGGRRQSLLRAEGMVPSSPMEPCSSSIGAVTISRRWSGTAPIVLGIPRAAAKWNGGRAATLIIMAMLGIDISRICSTFCTDTDLFWSPRVRGTWGFLDQPELIRQLGCSWTCGCIQMEFLTAVCRLIGCFCLIHRRWCIVGFIGILRRNKRRE